MTAAFIANSARERHVGAHGAGLDPCGQRRVDGAQALGLRERVEQPDQRIETHGGESEPHAAVLHVERVDRGAQTALGEHALDRRARIAGLGARGRALQRDQVIRLRAGGGQHCLRARQVALEPRDVGDHRLPDPQPQHGERDDDRREREQRALAPRRTVPDARERR